ncbi:UBA-like superfamily [Arabidopsis thaliana x Arabidopsis arenosa]|uniref:UBA-like superfamily n=1 Tax=Arabidopsis thaliana x Arabidopsis arenosa TaxID=1240361 RepID=A0A8T1Y7M5_9BRAS|nr:UBA-like superfamily [Arabidopsis thaliana x Arabidopsis arenosa]
MGHIFSANNQQRVITTRPDLDEEIVLFRQDQLISSFLEIAVGQTTETARRFLQTTDWDINQAINLFLTNNNDSSMYYDSQDADSTTSGTSDDSNYEDSNSEEFSSSFPPPYILQEGLFEEAKSVSIANNLWLIVNLQSRTELASHTLNRDVWAKDAVSQNIESSCIVWQVYDDTNEGQKVSSFYKIESAPPVVFIINPITGQKMHMWSGVIEADSFVEDLMMFRDAGPHENIASLTRNRGTETTDTCSSSNNIYYETPPPSWGEEFEKEDTWSSRNSNNQTPSWEKEFDDQDPVETWSSHSDTDDFVPPFIGDEYEDSDEVKEEETCLVFPVLTEEPKGECDRSVVCSLCVRFPDGRRKQRRFLKSEPIQLLWSFCYSHMDESEKRSFKLVQAIPGASRTLDYEADTTFDQSGLANSMISVTWE